MGEHLWEFSPGYYVPEHGWNSGMDPEEWGSWPEFEHSFKGMDGTLLVIRWQWHEGPDDEGPGTPFAGDPYYRNGVVEIGLFVQGKGLYVRHDIDVCRADEPAVKAWLAKRWADLRDM